MNQRSIDSKHQRINVLTKQLLNLGVSLAEVCSVRTQALPISSDEQRMDRIIEDYEDMVNTLIC